MKVGDLVKVYNFSQRARTQLRESFGEGTDDHMVGLIVGNGETFYREVLRCIDAQKEIYKTDRLEVINESR